MDQYIGKLLDGRYELLERIGNGGMAVVYKARCHRLNRLVAVKILKPDLASDAEFRRRFHDESQAVAMLSHANIVSVYDVSSSDDLDYIVMELIDGISLKQYMQKRGVPLNWREALHFITQIVKALGHAHSRGIIHRDIKPHNVMVLRDGSIKVADFGIARILSGSHSTLTQEALGSVHYISPEQARGSRIDGRSDLYSAGVVLYEMITGRLPFEGETPVSVAIQHINSIPISPRELNPELPEALEAITMKAMAPRVEQRYDSADDMLADLEEFRKNPSAVIAAPSGPDGEAEEPPPAEDADEPTQMMNAQQIREESGEIPPLERPRRTREAQPRPKPKPQPKPAPRPAEQRPSYQDFEEDEEEEDYRTRNWSGLIAGVVAVLVILLFVCGVAFFLLKNFVEPLLTPAETYEVPDVLGMTLSEIYADRSITSVFQILEGEPIYDEDYELGEVVHQVPAPGTSVKEGSLSITVRINTEDDSGELRMPEVLNMEQREAVALLQDEMGLVVKPEYENSETITAGHVMRYTPIEGVILQPGDEVTIVISLGPATEEVQVPLVEGLTLEAATEMLEGFDLVVGSVNPVHSETVEEGLIVLQSIKAYTEVPPGTVINLQISLGSANPPVPSDDPVPDESTEPSDEPVTGVAKTLSFDLSGYTGTIQLRVVVGEIEVFDAPVDTVIGLWTRSVSHTGVQMVYYYVNGALVKGESVDFSSNTE